MTEQLTQTTAGARTVTGRCLCGAVGVSASLAPPEVHACHCSMCRRWGSAPFMGVSINAADISIEGEENIAVFASSAWGERGFCRHCGSAVFWRFKGGDKYEVSAGLLGLDAGARLTSQIFIDEKPAFYDFANDTEKLTGAQVQAMFAPGSETSS